MPDIDEELSRFSRTWLKPGGTRGTRGTQNNFKEMAVPRSQNEGGTGGTQLFPIGKREKGGTAKGEHVNELANNELEGAVPPVPRVPPFFNSKPKVSPGRLRGLAEFPTESWPDGTPAADIIRLDDIRAKLRNL